MVYDFRELTVDDILVLDNGVQIARFDTVSRRWSICRVSQSLKISLSSKYVRFFMFPELVMEVI